MKCVALTPSFMQEMYGLTNQMRRAAISIASNLAEVYGRRRYKDEFIRFLIYAQASCDETIEWIEYVRDCYKDLLSSPSKPNTNL